MQIIIFYRGRKYAKSWFLAWWMRSEFSHCATLLRRIGDRYELAESALFKGVHLSVRELNPDDWEAWKIPREHDLAIYWLSQHLGDRYGLRGLAGFIFRRIKGPPNQWWCSKACAAMANIPDPWRFDVATFRALCMSIGRKVDLP